MKIECTPKEIADFVIELQSQLTKKFETTVKFDGDDLVVPVSKHTAWREKTTRDYSSVLDDLPPIGGLHDI